MSNKNTIVALATADYPSAISIIRISGADTFSIINKIFRFKKIEKKLENQDSHTIHLGYIFDQEKEIDNVMISLFKSPNSYTSEDLVEIYCHGSPYITNYIIELLIKNGSYIAKPGEFTLRAFLNKKINLSQAEAIADLISSESESEHSIALNQLKGSISNKIKYLKSELIKLFSIFELNIDFSEEKINFFNKKEALKLIKNIEKEIKFLINSFSLGNSIKKGIIVIIIGPPNAGKSSFFNFLLKENRSIVSNIPGTTRDILEETLIIDGIRFRFIDSAGIRKTKNILENISIKNTFNYIIKSQVIFYIFDISNFKKKYLLEDIKNLYKKYSDKKIFIIGNKEDLINNKYDIKKIFKKIFITSVNKKSGIDKIIKELSFFFKKKNLKNNTLITNIRHYESLNKVLKNIFNIKKSINNKVPIDLISIDIKNSINNLGEISGEVTNKELLNNIFSKFCIGK